MHLTTDVAANNIKQQMNSCVFIRSPRYNLGKVCDSFVCHYIRKSTVYWQFVLTRSNSRYEQSGSEDLVCSLLLSQ